MEREFFTSDKRSAFESMEYAQWISFAPIIFQATRVLRETGILACVESRNITGGIEMEEIEAATKVSKYGVRILCEAALGIGLMFHKEEKYFLTKAGYYVLTDKLTKVNLDFNHDVCYEGMFSLDKCIKENKPHGLKHFGPWSTLYEALAHFPPKVRESWLAFDHYYSDISFEQVLTHVFKDRPKKLLDIGGNTGKFSIQCCNFCDQVEVTIMDLPGQTAMAKKNVDSLGLSERVKFYENDVLIEKNPFPKGFDVIWMSQFLDCFSDEQIISIIKRAKDSLNEDGVIFILEPFWDKQKFPSSAMSLQMTSLYFTAMANGNSQMYCSKVFNDLVEQSGMKIVEEINNLGVSNTLLKCKIK